MSFLRLAVIGCGHWGPNHIRNFDAHPRCEVVVAADVDPARLERVSELFRHVRVTTDVAAVVTSDEVDAVVIATPTFTHAKLAEAALAAGKHVLCEKPLTMTADESIQLAQTAEASGRVLMVGHVFLFNSGILYLKEEISSGRFGRVLSLDSIRTNLGPFRRDVGCIYDLASHDISIFNYLLDATPVRVSTQTASFLNNTPHEDVAYITLQYPENVVCHAHVSWLNPRKVRQITAVSDRMMGVWDDMEVTEKIRLYDKGVEGRQDYDDFAGFQMMIRDNSIMIPRIRPAEPLALQSDHFVAAILDGLPVLPDGHNGLAVVRTLEACLRSAESQGQFVDVMTGG